MEAVAEVEAAEEEELVLGNRLLVALGLPGRL